MAITLSLRNRKCILLFSPTTSGGGLLARRKRRRPVPKVVAPNARAWDNNGRTATVLSVQRLGDSLATIEEKVSFWGFACWKRGSVGLTELSHLSQWVHFYACLIRFKQHRMTHVSIVERSKLSQQTLYKSCLNKLSQFVLARLSRFTELSQLS